MQRKTKTDWEKVSKVIDYEDFFHKYLIHPESSRLLGDVNDLIGADLGCGNGIFINQILKKGAKKVYAIDVSQKMLDVARQNNNNQGVEYIEADITKLIPISDTSCHFVIQIMLLHTLSSIHKVVSESYRILKKNGVCLVVIPHPVALHMGHFISLHDFNKEDYIHQQSCSFIWNRTEEKIFMEFYSRPLSDIINPYLKEGFILEELSEPVVPERKYVKGKIVESNIENIDISKIYKSMRTQPRFLFLKFRKK